MDSVGILRANEWGYKLKHTSDEATTHAFELKTGAAARSARRRTEKYGEDAPETVSRLWAKSLYCKERLCRAFQKGGA